MAYLEELLPEFRKGAKIRIKNWPNPFYYEMRNGKVYNQDGYKVNVFSHPALFENVWELYQEPIDWQYIIDHKCLCLFWDEGKEEIRTMRYLSRIYNSNDVKEPFISNHPICGYLSFQHCRPVRRDEVNFYEDKKDD